MYETIPKIRLLINLLLTLEVCIGVALIGTSAYFQRELGTFLTETENNMVSAKFFNVYILGFQLIVLYLCSLSMWSSIWPRRYSENIHLLLNVWLIFCCLIVICGCFTTWSLVVSGDALAEGIEMVLLRGIDIYYVNPEWKLLWDQLQYTKECCGVHGYRDWMRASWMTENLNTMTLRHSRNLHNRNVHELSNSQTLHDIQVPFYDTYLDPEYIYMESTIEKHQNQDDKIIKTYLYLNIHIYYNFLKCFTDLIVSFIIYRPEQTLAPYACCKHASASCYKNYIPQLTKDNGNIAHLNLTDINTDGCLEQFTKYLSMATTIIFILIFIAVLIDVRAS